MAVARVPAITNKCFQEENEIYSVPSDIETSNEKVPFNYEDIEFQFNRILIHLNYCRKAYFNRMAEKLNRSTIQSTKENAASYQKWQITAFSGLLIALKASEILVVAVPQTLTESAKGINYWSSSQLMDLSGYHNLATGAFDYSALSKASGKVLSFADQIAQTTKNCYDQSLEADRIYLRGLSERVKALWDQERQNTQQEKSQLEDAIRQLARILEKKRELTSTLTR